jgi:hypothetical protein
MATCKIQVEEKNIGYGILLLIFNVIKKCIYRYIRNIIFITGDAQTLLRTVWLNNGVYFGMRGRQDHTNLLWGDIELKRAPYSREYLEFTGLLNCMKCL